MYVQQWQDGKTACLGLIIIGCWSIISDDRLRLMPLFSLSRDKNIFKMQSLVRRAIRKPRPNKMHGKNTFCFN